jgi:hypothetical protein
MKLPKNIECYLRIDGFLLLLERQHQTLHFRQADDHDRFEMLRYFSSATDNPELKTNLEQLKSERSTGVLWYFPILPSEFSSVENPEFIRMREDYERTRRQLLEEIVWTYKFVPTMQNSTFMAHSTVLRLLETAQIVSEARTDFPIGVEVLTEDAYELEFGLVSQTGLLPSVLNVLEADAERYVELFLNHGRLFTPNEAQFWRENILSKLEQHNLIDCDIIPVIFKQLKKYPNLNRCVLATEYFRMYMDFTISGAKIKDCPLALDWMMFDPDFPTDFEMDSWDFLQHCLSVFEAAKLEYPYTLQTEIQGQQYRLITGFDAGRIKLLTVLEPKAMSQFFVDPFKPSYLEIADWFSYAGRNDPAMNWDLVMQWDGLLDELTDLAADPNLPDADYLLHCLYCYVAASRGTGLGGYAPFFLHHPSPRIKRLGQRCLAVANGELEFVYHDWCGWGFVSTEQTIQSKKVTGKRHKA